MLFLCMLMTSMGVFLGSNLLLMDGNVFKYSWPIGLISIGLLCFFYAISNILSGSLSGIVITYLTLCCVVAFKSKWINAGCYSLMLASAVYVVRNLRIDRGNIGKLLVMTGIGMIVSIGSNSPCTFDIIRRMYAGVVHTDTLYLASIAAMIKNYNVVSTGLHGLVVTPYHCLSHVLYAGISILSHEGVIETYGVATSLMFVPILIFSTVSASLMLEHRLHCSISLVWSLACGFIVILPVLLELWGVDEAFLASESYLSSLLLFLLAMPYLYGKDDLTLLELLILCVGSILMCIAKSSVGIVFLILWGLRLAFIKKKRQPGENTCFLISLICSFCILFWIAKASVGTGEQVTLTPFQFDFIKRYCVFSECINQLILRLSRSQSVDLLTAIKAIAAILCFYFMHFIISWFVIFRSSRGKSLVNILRHPIAIYSLSAIVVGSLIIMNFYMYGGSEYYFSNIAFFISLPSFIIITTCIIEHYKIPAKLLITAIVVAMVFIKAPSILSKSFYSRPSFTKKHKKFVDQLIALRGAGSNIALNPTGVFKTDNPVTRLCAQPFIYPAISEKPWINIIEKSNVPNKAWDPSYGYKNYKIDPTTLQVTVKPVLKPGMKIMNYRFQ